jgi:hypothetical protein
VSTKKHIAIVLASVYAYAVAFGRRFDLSIPRPGKNEDFIAYMQIVSYRWKMDLSTNLLHKLTSNDAVCMGRCNPGSGVIPATRTFSSLLSGKRSNMLPGLGSILDTKLILMLRHQYCLATSLGASDPYLRQVQNGVASLLYGRSLPCHPDSCAHNRKMILRRLASLSTSAAHRHGTAFAFVFKLA